MRVYVVIFRFPALQQPEQQQAEGHPGRCLRRSQRSFGAAFDWKQADGDTGTHVPRPQRPENPVSFIRVACAI